MKRFILATAIALSMVLSLAACGGGHAPSGQPGSYSASSAPSAPPAGDYAAEYTGDAYPGKYADGGSASPLPLLTPDNDEGNRLVYTVDMQLETTQFMEGTRALLTTVADMGGHVRSTFVQGRHLFDESATRYARYTLQIPSASLAEFLMAMEDSYNLLRLEQNSEDITARTEQTDSRLEYLLAQEQRLLETLADAGDTEEILSLEYELTDIQAQISSLKASAGVLERAVVYSSVTVHLYEVIPPETREELTWSQRLSNTADNSANGFVALGQNLLLFLIAALPTLVVLAVVGALVWLGIRLLKKRGIDLTQKAKDGVKRDDETR